MPRKATAAASQSTPQPGPSRSPRSPRVKGLKGTGGAKGSRFKRILDFALRYVLPSGVSVLLIIWFFSEVNFNKVMEVIHRGCDIGWIIGMMVVTILNMSCRGIRWGIQLRGVGIPRMPAIAECASIYGAYALNLVFPRLGEMWRCLYISRRQHCPFTTVLGTDLGDRTSDMICVFAFLLLGVIFTDAQLDRFIDHYAVGRAIRDIVTNKWVWTGVILGIGGYVALVHFGAKHRWVQKIKEGASNIWTGFIILFRMPQLGLYLWLTLGIWGCYFLETYLSLYAFPFTRHWMMGPGLAWGLKPGLVMMIFSVFSTAIPSNGGLGPWTISVTYALTLFGLPTAEAAAFALVVWGFQQSIIVVVGIITFIFIMRRRRRERRLLPALPAEAAAPHSVAAAAAAQPEKSHIA